MTVRVHIAALLTQVTDARFNPRAGFSHHYLNGSNELVARMSPAVSSGKHGGVLSRLFLFNSGSELVPRMSPLVSSGRRGGVAGRLFRLNSGNELVARASLAVCLVKHDGRLGSLFRIAGNRT